MPKVHWSIQSCIVQSTVCSQANETTSSVARGGREGAWAPHWLVKYAKSNVFGAFEADFWWKIKNSPPKGNWVPKLWRSCKVYVVIRSKKRLNFRFWWKMQSKFRWRPFFFFFRRSPVFGRIKRLNFQGFREIPSQFLDKPCDSDSKTMKIRVKVVCTFLTLSKKPPPPPPPFSKSWLRAWKPQVKAI